MLQQGKCSHCLKEFTYNDQDRSGKFCSKKCHYNSKNEIATCCFCSKEFERRIKEARKTCSKECWVGQRGLRSKNPKVKEFHEFLRARNGGQFAAEEFLNCSIMKIDPSENKTLLERVTIAFKDYALNVIKTLKLDK